MENAKDPKPIEVSLREMMDKSENTFSFISYTFLKPLLEEACSELEALREQKRLTDILAEKARAFEWAASMEIERLLKLIHDGDRPEVICASDPCPYCTAGSELDIARLDITSPGWRDDPIAY